jgi:flagellar biosynthesis/type III secretory pathway protein FliH
VPEDFVSLAAILAGGGRAPAPAAERAAPAAVAEPPAADVGAELARLHLAAAEALERRVARLLEGLARDVLARELQLAPADLRTLAANALAAFRDERPFAFAISPEDADGFEGALPVRADPSLRPGDLVVEVRDGALESHLSFRLATVVRRAAYDDDDP